jgi:hypothetical protein
MLKMTCSSKYHCKFILVTIVDAHIGFYRSSWLNNSRYTSLFAITTQSGKGKKMLAMTVRLNQNQRFLLSIAWSKASTQVWPVPKILVFFCKTIRVRFCVLQTLEANIKSWISFCRTRYSNGLQIFFVSVILFLIKVRLDKI